jgi:phospholipase C
LRNRKVFASAAAGLMAAGTIAAGLGMAGASPSGPATTTPIKHVVVIFDENVSFDHYFGTYPYAANVPGEPQFTAAPGTPTVNGLSNTLLYDNPNQLNPERLDRSQPITCDQDHDYTPEQQAADGGLMDGFVQYTAGGPEESPPCPKPVVMDYYDGNTVTGLWNYAQHYALNDNSFGTTFGPSTPGALNLIAGQTAGASPAIAGTVENGTAINDDDPAYDDCSGSSTFSMSGPNIGNLLNAKGLTWGWFEGGFAPTATNGGKAVCGSSHTNVANATVSDYSAHHEPFQYYASTANPHHLPPSSPNMIGQTDQANHQYDISDFAQAIDDSVMPAVSFLKAPRYEDGHAGYSDPLDEQRWLVDTINEIQQSKYWASTAIVIAYDDSDGWYDHVMGPIVHPSAGPSDALNGAASGTSANGKCGNLPSPLPSGFQNDRCGFGPRLPLLVISPYARQNYVDNTLTDQSSIIKFVEDNWQLGTLGGGSADASAGPLLNMFNFSGSNLAPKLNLDDQSGEPVTPSNPGPGNITPESNTSSTAGRSDSVPAQGSPSAASLPAAASSPASTAGSSSGSNNTGKLTFTCKVQNRTRQVRVNCVTHGAAASSRATLRLRLERGGKVFANQYVPVRGGRASVLLRQASTLKRGRYTLRLAIDSALGGQPGQVIGQQHTLSLG